MKFKWSVRRSHGNQSKTAAFSIFGAVFNGFGAVFDRSSSGGGGSSNNRSSSRRRSNPPGEAHCLLSTYERTCLNFGRPEQVFAGYGSPEIDNNHCKSLEKIEGSETFQTS